MNKAVIFCAPSGSGKTTIVKHLLQSIPELMFSVSACTRARRENETDGKDYYFLSHDRFQEKIRNNEFLEYEEVYGGNFYGTLKSEIDRIWALQKTVIFDVDVIGGQHIKSHFGSQALAVFVKPPNIQVLEQRLRHRSTETEQTLRIRIDKAIHELTYEHRFDYVLLNDNLEQALEEARQLINQFLKQ